MSIVRIIKRIRTSCMKLCTNCLYCEVVQDVHLCRQVRSPVTGEVIGLCNIMRIESGYPALGTNLICGLEAKLFEPRDMPVLETGQ